MSPEAWFQVANTIALTGWLALALSPIAPRLLALLGGIAMPLLLSGGYTAIVLAHWASGQGGFDSLGAVAQLFENRWLLLAGWVHYLAFDLLLGAWQVRTARREGIAHLALLPCLLAFAQPARLAALAPASQSGFRWSLPTLLPLAAVFLQLATLGCLFTLIALLCDSVWALVAGHARTWFGRNPRRLGQMSAGGGAMMIGLGGVLVATGNKT